MNKTIGFTSWLYKDGRKVCISQQVRYVRLDYSGGSKRDITRRVHVPFDKIVSDMLDHGYIKLA